MFLNLGSNSHPQNFDKKKFLTSMIMILISVTYLLPIYPWNIILYIFLTNVSQLILRIPLGSSIWTINFLVPILIVVFSGAYW